MLYIGLLIAIVNLVAMIIGKLQNLDTLALGAMILSYSSLSFSAFLVSGRLDGVLRVFMRFFGTGWLIVVLALVPLLFNIQASLILFFPAFLLYIIGSFITLRFLYGLNTENGGLNLLIAVIVGVLSAAGANVFLGDAANRDAFSYYTYLILGGMSLMFCTYYLLSALWTQGGIWSQYFLIPYVSLSFFFAVYSVFTAAGANETQPLVDIFHQVGQSIFFVSMLRLFSARQTRVVTPVPA
jgi:hypothetical protein